MKFITFILLTLFSYNSFARITLSDDFLKGYFAFTEKYGDSIFITPVIERLNCGKVNSDGNISFCLASFNVGQTPNKIIPNNLFLCEFDSFNITVSPFYKYDYFVPDAMNKPKNFLGIFSQDLIHITDLPVSSPCLNSNVDIPYKNNECWELLVSNPYIWHKEMLSSKPLEKYCLLNLSEKELERHLYFLSIKANYLDEISNVRIIERTDGICFLCISQTYIQIYIPSVKYEQSIQIWDEGLIESKIIDNIISTYQYHNKSSLGLEEQFSYIIDDIVSNPATAIDKELIEKILSQKANITNWSDLVNRCQDLNCISEVYIRPYNHFVSCSLLHLAIYYNNFELVKVLLDQSVDINVKNQYGETPLNLAMSQGNKDIISLLLSVKPDYSIADYFGGKAYDYCSNINLINNIDGDSIVPPELWIININEAKSKLFSYRLSNNNIGSLIFVKKNIKNKEYIFLYEDGNYKVNANDGSITEINIFNDMDSQLLKGELNTFRKVRKFSNNEDI